MIEINNERENIDNIDNMIFDLLVDRLDPVMKIGEIKSKNNIEFLCGINLYKRLKLKKIPEFINIV